MRGYKFLDTSPSPAPSALGASPFMTWGELDSTPCRLDDGAVTPLIVSGAPAFRIPSPSKREQLAHKLADKASRQRLRDRHEAVKRVHSGHSSPAARVLLSPAARRLLASSSNLVSLSGGSRPSTGVSLTSFASSPSTKLLTPQGQLSHLKAALRATSTCSSPVPVVTQTISNKLSTISHETESSDPVSHSNNSHSITDNLLNLRSH
ncbi:unnamed protein product [Dicrocoelium dendriticum]|nr:unnamed protein product [Dicrocoelium dendriticum]